MIKAESGIAMVDLTLIFSGVSNFVLVLIGNGGFGASPLRTTVTSILAGAFFFFESHFLEKTCKLVIFQCFFIKMTLK